MWKEDKKKVNLHVSGTTQLIIYIQLFPIISHAPHNNRIF